MKRPPNIIVPPPRATQGPRAGVTALERAQVLACLVRDESADTTGPWLDALDRDALYALAVTLAAMVPPDRSADDLLAWLDAPLAVVA